LKIKSQTQASKTLSTKIVIMVSYPKEVLPDFPILEVELERLLEDSVSFVPVFK